jgi:hypothetical protein
MLPVTKEWRVTSTTTVSVWQPEAPEGYVSLGHVVCVGALTSADALRSVVERDSGSPLMCVLREAIAPASHSQAWSDCNTHSVLVMDNPLATFWFYTKQLDPEKMPMFRFGTVDVPGLTLASAHVESDVHCCDCGCLEGCRDRALKPADSGSSDVKCGD